MTEVTNWTASIATEDGTLKCLVTGAACNFKYPLMSCVSCGRIPLIHQKGGFSKSESVPCQAGGTCQYESNVCIKCSIEKPAVSIEGTFNVAIDDHLYNKVEAFNTKSHKIKVQHVVMSEAFSTELDEGTEPFVDDSFFGKVALRPNQEYPMNDVFKWFRPTERGYGDSKLFKNEASYNDVNQGGMGDCYFISSMSIIGTRKDLLKYNIAVDSTNPSRGRYGFRFYKEGEWKTIEVDDRLPCTRDKALCFAKCVEPNEIWVPMMEKAYAKLFGSYTSLSGGWTRDALVDLTGGVAAYVDVAKTASLDNKLWDLLYNDIKSKDVLLGCSADGGSEAAMSNTGLFSGHAYAILDCVEVDNIKLFHIRNPWGQSEWQGAWSDSSPLWKQHPKVAEAVKQVAKEDGAFWMSYKDFCKYWTMVDIVRLYPKEKGWVCKMQQSEWKGVTAGGPLERDIRKSRANPQFVLNVEKDSEVVVSVMQKDYRYEKDAKTDDIEMTFYVVKIDDSTYNAEYPEQTPRLFTYNANNNMLSPSWNWGREVSGSAKLTKGTYIVVPCTVRPNVETSFFVRVFAQSPIVFKHIEPLEASYTNTTFEGQWSGESAGGSMTNFSWIYNPQFRFRFNSDKVAPKNIQVTLRQNRTDSVGLTHIGFYVMNGNDRGAPIFDKTTKLYETGVFKRSREVSLTIPAQPNKTYNIIPCCYAAGEEGKFTLTVSWVKDDTVKTFVQPCLDFPFTALEGQWTAKNSGGSRMQKTYNKNPKYSLHLSEDAVIDVVLAQKVDTKPLAIGLDVHDTKTGAVIAKNEKWNYQKVVSLTCNLKAGEYMVVPSTFNPGQFASFVLKIRSATENYTFKEL